MPVEKETRYQRERAQEEQEMKDREDAEQKERETRREGEKKTKEDREIEIAELASVLNGDMEAKFSAGLLTRAELEDLSTAVSALFKKAEKYKTASGIDLSGIPEYERLEQNRITLDSNIKEYVDSLKEPISEKATALEDYLNDLKGKDKGAKGDKLDKTKISCFLEIGKAVKEAQDFLEYQERVLAGTTFLEEETSGLPKVRECVKKLVEREDDFKKAIVEDLENVLAVKAEELKGKSKEKSEATGRDKDEETLTDLEDVCGFVADIKESLKDTGIDCELKPNWEEIGRFRISKNAALQKILKDEMVLIGNEKNLTDAKGEKRNLATVVNELAPDIKWLQGHLEKMEGNPYFGVAMDAKKDKIKRYAETIEDKEIVENDLQKDLKAKSDEFEAFFNESDIEGRTSDENKAFWDSLDTPDKIAAYVASVESFVGGKKRDAEDFNSSFKKVWDDAFPSLKDDDSAWQIVKLDDCEDWNMLNAYLKKFHDEQITDSEVGRLYDDDFVKKRDELNLLRKTKDQNFLDLKELNRLTKMKDEGNLDDAGYAQLDIISDRVFDFERDYRALLSSKTNIGLEEMERDITRLSGLEEAGTATAEERDMLESLILMKNIFDGQYIEARSELAGLIEDKKANYLEKREYKELKELYDSLAKSDESIKSVETSEVYFEEVRDRLDDLKRDGKATQPELEELNNAESKLIELKESKEAFLREREVLLRQRDEKNTYYLESSLERLMNLDEDNEATPEDREELLGLASLRDGIDAYAENSPDASPAEIRNEFKKLDEMSALKRDVRRERQLTKELEPILSRVNILRGMKADMIFTKAETEELEKLSRHGNVLTPDERIELEELKRKKETNLSIIRDDLKGDATFTSDESKRLDDLLKKNSNAENIEFERLSKKKDAFENEIARIEAEDKRMAEFGPKITTTPESELPLEIRKHYMRDKTIEDIKDASVSTLAFGITALPLFLKKLKCALGDFLCLVRTGKLPTASKSKK